MWLNWKLRPTGWRRSLGEVVAFLASWAWLPLVGFVLVALPAVDAHTRLLFGRYLQYQVTEKQGYTRLERSPTGSLVQPGEAA